MSSQVMRLMIKQKQEKQIKAYWCNGFIVNFQTFFCSCQCCKMCCHWVSDLLVTLLCTTPSTTARHWVSSSWYKCWHTRMLCIFVFLSGWNHITEDNRSLNLLFCSLTHCLWTYTYKYRWLLSSLLSIVYICTYVSYAVDCLVLI